MFSYYGSKSKIVQYYPQPTHDKIIEPFAGSARYSLRYFEKDVLLVDKYKVIVDIWHYLQRASEKDILGLPRVKQNETIDDFNLSGIEKLFMGFILKDAVTTPCKKVSPNWLKERPNKINYKLQRISKDLHKIKHWKIIQGSYEDLQNENATWFIDPPYQFGGHSYKESNKNINYDLLANWCKSRLGQVIVCENTLANWIELNPMIRFKGANKTNTKQEYEAIWTNFKTQYDSIQQELFLGGVK